MTGEGILTFRTVVVRPSAIPGHLIAGETGKQADVFGSAEDVVRSIKRRDQAAAGRGRSTVTRLVWEGFPAGFVPPGT